MQSSLIQGVMYFSHPQGVAAGGWSEKYFFVGADYSNALGHFADLVAWRLLISPPTVKLVFARINRIKAPRDHVPALLDYPVAGLAGSLTTPPALTCTDPAIALQFETDTIITGPDGVAQGEFADHYIRGLPGNLIKDMAYVVVAGTPAVITVGTVDPGPPGTVATHAAAVSGFITKVATTTALAQYRPILVTTPPTPQWLVTPWDTAIPRGVTRRRIGSPFGLKRGRARKRT